MHPAIQCWARAAADVPSQPEEHARSTLDLEGSGWRMGPSTGRGVGEEWTREDQGGSVNKLKVAYLIDADTPRPKVPELAMHEAGNGRCVGPLQQHFL